ncbi:MAG: hypothetical protein M1820_000793 [Bogoriella megaspora]|nr:MAG: hypothetical protein M1820_000793 [Bogoriella megaspora]
MSSLHTTLSLQSFFVTLLASLSLAASKAEYLNNAINASNVLQEVYYNTTSGLWGETWWNSGNALTVTADLVKHYPDALSAAENIFATTFQNAPGRGGGQGWTNTYYDDEGWWALGWIDAYDVTQNGDYLQAAIDTYNDMQGGNGATCGGHWWNKSDCCNTAIANELYMSVAAHLAKRTSGDAQSGYIQDAQNEWNWFKNSGLIDADNIIHDGLDLTTCQVPSGSATFTYNQGVILGGLIALNDVAPDTSYLQQASLIANAAITHLVNSDGIMVEYGNSLTPDENGSQFKGVFARNLMRLQKVQPEDKFVTFLQKNADSMWANGRDASTGLIGPDWQGPYEDQTMSSQDSAVSLLLGAFVVSQ